MFRHIFQLETALDNRTAINRTPLKTAGLCEIHCSQYYGSRSAFRHPRRAYGGSCREGLGPSAGPQLAGTGRGAAPRPPAAPAARLPRGLAARRAGPAGPRRGLPFPWQQAGRPPALRPGPRSAGAGGPAGAAAAVPPAGWGWSWSRSRCSRPGATSGGGSFGSARISARSCWRGRPASR